MKTFGQIAYEAYAESQHWLWLGSDRMPQWEDHPASVTRAWEEAAAAVLRAAPRTGETS